MGRKKLISAGVVVGLALILGAIPAQSHDRTDSDVQRRWGKVTSIEGNTFTLQTRRAGELKVQHDANTEWYRGSTSELEEGSLVGVVGTLTNDVIHATKVGFIKEGERPRHRRPRLIRGEITETGEGQFTLRTRRGEVTVKWNEDTQFHNGASANLEVGAMVGVAGRIERPDSEEVSAEARPLDRRARLELRVRAGEITIVANHIVFPKPRPEGETQPRAG